MTNLLDREQFETEPEFEDELEWFDEYEDEQLDADLEHKDELELFDYELEDLFNRRLEQERQAIAGTIRQGNRDENKLTNMVFFRRHPERQDLQFLKEAFFVGWVLIRESGKARKMVGSECPPFPELWRR